MFFRKIITLVALLSTSAAYAVPMLTSTDDIDFRDGSIWGPAYNQATFTHEQITVTALPSGKKLYRDNVDGFGVLTGEFDEVNPGEFLEVTFSQQTLLTGVWITDLFDAPDGFNGEDGKVEIYTRTGDLLVFNFNGNNSDQINGEQYVDFLGYHDVVRALFMTTDNRGDEFSVAGFTAVPEPTALALFSLLMMMFFGYLKLTRRAQ